MKTHISLSTTDLDASVRFYTTLLGVAPMKHYDDYAFFVADDPGLELAINQTAIKTPSIGVHYGIAVCSPEAVDAAVARLENANFPVDIEIEETCCYAKQTKAWVTDPDGRRWETYVVLEEVPETEAAGCCTA